MAEFASPRLHRTTLTQLINQVAQFLGELRMPGPRGFRSHLHRHGVELGVVALGVAHDERFS